MSPHPFLSPAWIAAARELYDEYADRLDPPTEAVRMNFTVTDAPYDDAEVLGHLDTTGGDTIPKEGHVDDPQVSVQIPFAVARTLLLEQQPESLMVAFMSGEIEVEGDVTMLMSLQEIEPTPEQQTLAEEVVARLLEMT